MSHEKHQETIDLLLKCATECNHCTSACLDEQDVKKLARCIKLNIDCMEVCYLTASYLSRGSEQGDGIMRICAEICEACARECEKHSNMEHCMRCADICHKCAEACSQPV